MTEHATLTPEDAALAAEFAMGLLTDAELADFQARVRIDPVLFGEVQDWQEHLALLTEGIDEKPGKHVKRRLEARLFGIPTRALRFWQGVSGAAIMACAVIAMLFFAQPTPQPGPIYAAEIVAEDDSLRVLAVFDGDRLRLTRTNGAPKAGRALELWLIEGDNAPVSLGVLADTSASHKSIPDALRLSLASGVLAISDEPLGGSPSGAPTGDVLAIGSITSL